MPKRPKEIELLIPDPIPDVDRWIILGLDPSISRTGYAIMLVERKEDKSGASWIKVGSLKPDTDASTPTWIRAKSVALTVTSILADTMEQLVVDDEWIKRTGLIISMEAPTPQNDFLNTISIVLRIFLLDIEGVMGKYLRAMRCFVQLTNAATMRSLMGLVQKGAGNKKENITRALLFLGEGYANLDTDACDGVLMAMMARYSASILLGFPYTISERFLQALCDGTQVEAKKGGRAIIRTKGLLHRPEYWMAHQHSEYTVKLRDARDKKARLDQVKFTI